jgi:predicted MPP superfamily phosphohydrolase
LLRVGPSVAVRRFAGHISHSELFDEPLVVAHLTDQHVGRVTSMEAQLEAVRCANEAKPDLVCLTGDFVCHSQAYLDDLREVIEAFEAPVVAVLGNHDHWCGAQDVAKTLVHAGACVLRNSMTTLEVRHQRLQIVGLDDAYTGHADAARAVRGLRPMLPAIGLSHIAEEADRLWDCGVPLVLSGHTHAGQITVARLHELSIGKVGGHRYVHGLYGERKGEGAVYVGAGIGAAMLPIRLGERGRREVAIFELGAMPGSLEEHHDEQIALPGRKPSAELKARRQAAAAKKAAKRSRRH